MARLPAIALGLAAAVALALSPVAAPDAHALLLYGDVNCTGEVDSVDATLILQHAAELSPFLKCAFQGDVNLDDKTGAIDAALVLQYVAGLVEHLGPETQFDFSIRTSGSATVPEGKVSVTTTASITIEVAQGEPEFVYLTTHSEPFGANAAFIDPGQAGFVAGCLPPCTLGIHLGFIPRAQGDGYVLTITGTATGLLHAADLTINVVPQATPLP